MHLKIHTDNDIIKERKKENFLTISINAYIFKLYLLFLVKKLTEIVTSYS
jgi:hypothetical protein